MESEAEKLREEAQSRSQSQSQEGGDEGEAITDEDIMILMQPKLSINEAETKENAEAQARKILAKAEKKSRRMTMKAKKRYKNVKSKIHHPKNIKKAAAESDEKSEEHHSGNRIQLSLTFLSCLISAKNFIFL